MKVISFSMTERQLLDGSKTVTRRTGWQRLKAGDKLRAVRKAMGLKLGEQVQDLGTITVVSVRRERLNDMTEEDVALEGFPEMSRAEFIEWFSREQYLIGLDYVTRIEFRFEVGVPA